ncbi:MAG: serine/threonine-protein kinase [Polyangiaceae bacterium]
MSTPLSPGAILAGKYRLVAPLGAGGMGTVWRADHLLLNTPVAVKVLNERAQDSASGPTRFLREAQAAAALRSPHVVQILDVGLEGNTPFIVMELLEGESLAARLRRVGRIDLAATSSIVAQTARALHKAHESGIVHRDLKPDNIFLVHDVDRELVKVLDFGIAKLVEQMEVSQLTGTGAVLGTPHYMSPEQARGRREVDQRTDLWSLGVITYECLTGRRPFDSHALGDLLLLICTEDAPPPSTAGGLPPALDAFMARALARDPAHRFSSALEFAEALHQLAGVPPSTLASIPPHSAQSLHAAQALHTAQPSHQSVAAAPGSFGSGTPSHAPVAALSATPSVAAATTSLGPASVAHSGQSGGGRTLVILAALGVAGLGLAAVIGGGAWLYSSSLSEGSAAPSTAAPHATTTPPPTASAESTTAEPAPSPAPTPTGKSSPKPSPVAAPAPTSAPAPAPSPAPASTATGSSAVCDAACAKLKGCGASCPGGPCIGIKLSAAHCINGKKTCLDIASCF